MGNGAQSISNAMVETFGKNTTLLLLLNSKYKKVQKIVRDIIKNVYQLFISQLTLGRSVKVVYSINLAYIFIYSCNKS